MGNGGGLPSRLSPEDEQCFPNLRAVGYRVTSKKDPVYNCVAYAADDETQKWDPTGIPLPGYYWPPTADRGEGADSLRSCFEAVGYELCENGDHETGYHKVALYIDDDGFWAHAAKQIGVEWASKLGSEEDIRHATPHCFGGSIYGNVVYFMRKPLEGNENVEEQETKEEAAATEARAAVAPEPPDHTGSDDA